MNNQKGHSPIMMENSEKSHKARERMIRVKKKNIHATTAEHTAVMLYDHLVCSPMIYG